MGAIRRGYARRFGTAADACYALRQCKFAALTLFVAPILPARSIRCSRHVPRLGVLLLSLARYSSWVFCCAFWPDDGHPLHSTHCVQPIAFNPLRSTHCVQPIAFVTECRRFGLMQFPSSQLPFFILALRLFRHSRCFFLLVANLVFAALRMRYCMGRV